MHAGQSYDLKGRRLFLGGDFFCSSPEDAEGAGDKRIRLAFLSGEDLLHSSAVVAVASLLLALVVSMIAVHDVHVHVVGDFVGFGGSKYT